jgi:hypothetical protein
VKRRRRGLALCAGKKIGKASDKLFKDFPPKAK